MMQAINPVQKQTLATVCARQKEERSRSRVFTHLGSKYLSRESICEKRQKFQSDNTGRFFGLVVATESEEVTLETELVLGSRSKE